MTSWQLALCALAQYEKYTGGVRKLKIIEVYICKIFKSRNVWPSEKKTQSDLKENLKKSKNQRILLNTLKPAN